MEIFKLLHWFYTCFWSFHYFYTTTIHDKLRLNIFLAQLWSYLSIGVKIKFIPFLLRLLCACQHQIWKKAYQIALAKLWVWKICTQNMCKKCLELCKNTKNCTKKQKKLNAWRKEKKAQLWKVSTSAVSVFLCSHNVP